MLIRYGRDIGEKGNPSRKYIYYACAGCGKRRWVRLVKGKPEYDYCHSCARLVKCSQKGDKNFNWKGGKKKNGEYNMVYDPQNKMANCSGYVVKGRLVLSEKLGCSLKRDELARHINNVKSDDAPENLKQVSKIDLPSIMRVEATKVKKSRREAEKLF